MPDSVEANLSDVEEKSKKIIEDFGGKIIKTENEPVAFGLIALKITFSLDEKNSNLDPLESQLTDMDEVSSAEVVEIRRAVG